MEKNPSNYSCYTGIVFDKNHFAVLDFLRNHRIVIVTDGFGNNWQGIISSIIEKNLILWSKQKLSTNTNLGMKQVFY